MIGLILSSGTVVVMAVLLSHVIVSVAVTTEPKIISSHALQFPEGHKMCGY